MTQIYSDKEKMSSCQMGLVWGDNYKEQNEIFWSDGRVLYFDCGVGYMTICLSQLYVCGVGYMTVCLDILWGMNFI